LLITRKRVETRSSWNDTFRPVDMTDRTNRGPNNKHARPRGKTRQCRSREPNEQSSFRRSNRRVVSYKICSTRTERVSNVGPNDHCGSNHTQYGDKRVYVNEKTPPAPTRPHRNQSTHARRIVSIPSPWPFRVRHTSVCHVRSDKPTNALFE